VSRQPATFLVVSLRYIGDVLLSTPLARSIRAARPEASVDFLVFEGTEGILAGNPDVRRVLTVRPGSRDRRDLLSHFREYDVAMGVNASDRTAFQLLAKGKKTVGFVDDRPKEWWKRALFTHATVHDPSRHTVEQLLGQLAPLGIPPVPEVSIHLDAADFAAARAAAGEAPFVLVHPYTRWIFKMWGAEKWAALYRLIGERTGVRVLFTTSPGAVEEGIRREIAAAGVPEAAFVAAPLSIRQVAALVALSDAYVGIDTMVTHLAAALGKQTVAVFGPTPVHRWAPWVNGPSPVSPWAMRGGTQRVGHVTVVQSGRECAGCDRMGCDHRVDSRSLCLEELPAETVFAGLSAGDPPDRRPQEAEREAR
jgi:heptosyltransferase-3